MVNYEDGLLIPGKCKGRWSASNFSSVSRSPVGFHRSCKLGESEDCVRHLFLMRIKVHNRNH